jgi:hypothetical protein
VSWRPGRNRTYLAFDEFVRDVAGRLPDLIEGAMRKAVSGPDADEVVREFGEPAAAKANSTQT